MSPTAGPPSTRTISAVLPPSSDTGSTCAMRVVSCRMWPATLLNAVPPLNTTSDGSGGCGCCCCSCWAPRAEAAAPWLPLAPPTGTVSMRSRWLSMPPAGQARERGGARVGWAAKEAARGRRGGFLAAQQCSTHRAAAAPWSALLQLPLLLHVAASAALAAGSGSRAAAAAAFTAMGCGASAELLRAIACRRDALQGPPGVQGLEQAGAERAGAQRGRLMLGSRESPCACPGALCRGGSGGREARQRACAQPSRAGGA